MFEKDDDYYKARKESKDRITKVIKVWNGKEEAIHDGGFQKGVEFGYNKANEWHYVKNGGFPKDGETVLVCRDDMQIWTGNRHSKRENSYFWYIHNLHGVLYKDSDIYAWKEIIPPKE